MFSSAETAKIIRVYYSYADKDQGLVTELEKQLKSLRRRGLIFDWHRHKIAPGQVTIDEIDKNLHEVDIILLLISPDFIDSDDCFSVEMKKALLRYGDGKARIVPILLRPCQWKGFPFSDFQVLPRNRKPVTRWTNRDAAFQHIAEEIELLAQEIREHGHGYLEPLRPNPSKAVPSGKETTLTTNAKSTTRARRTEAVARPRKRTLRDEDSVSSKKYLKALPKSDTTSNSVTVQSFFTFIRKNLSLKGFKKRCKGYSGILLFFFAVLDVLLLPGALYLWAHSWILFGAIVFISFLLFSMGVSNRDNAIGVPLAVIYFSVWGIIDIAFLAGYFNLRWSLLTFCVFLALIPFLRLMLFFKR